MSAAKSASKRREKEPEVRQPEKKTKIDDNIDLDLSSDLKCIMTALRQIKEKAQKDGQKRNEEIIGGVASDLKSMLDDAQAKVEKERQIFAKALSKSSKECESLLKNEAAKFQTTYEKFSKDKISHLQAFKDIFSKFEDEKEKLFARYEQQRKKEKTMLSELQKLCTDKIAAAEESLKKKKEDDSSLSLLRQKLGSFLDPASDEEFLADD